MTWSEYSFSFFVNSNGELHRDGLIEVIQDTKIDMKVYNCNA